MLSSRRGFLVALTSITGELALAGCDRGSKPAAEPARAERVVSVSPSMTEAVFAIGAGDRMVGRTTFCDYPPEAEKLPVVGGFLDASVEAILALEPTLVVGERRPGGKDLDETLRARGIKTYFPPMYSVREIKAMILELGEMLGEKKKASEVVWVLEKKLKEVRVRVADRARPKTLFLFDFHPLVAAGPDAFPNELLSLAGATNVVTSGGEYPRLSPEAVIGLDPDFVVDGSAGVYPEAPEVLLAQVPGLSTLRALGAHQVVRLETKTALRPGPRIALGVEEIARLVHPEVGR